MFSISADAFLKSFKAARKKLASDVFKALRRAAELARDHAKATRLFKDDTGELRKSIKVVSVNQSQVEVHATARHAEWVEKGNGFRTGAQYIYPRRCPFLIFRIDGRTIFAKRVRTTTPRPFMAEAQKHAESEFVKDCVTAANNMFAG